MIDLGSFRMKVNSRSGWNVLVVVSAVLALTSTVTRSMASSHAQRSSWDSVNHVEDCRSKLREKLRDLNMLVDLVAEQMFDGGTFDQYPLGHSPVEGELCTVVLDAPSEFVRAREAVGSSGERALQVICISRVDQPHLYEIYDEARELNAFLEHAAHAEH
ncbi:MAG: hypothetical protein AAGJ92_03660 [Pseudomonadota bacterium]